MVASPVQIRLLGTVALLLGKIAMTLSLSKRLAACLACHRFCGSTSDFYSQDYDADFGSCSVGTQGVTSTLATKLSTATQPFTTPTASDAPIAPTNTSMCLNAKGYQVSQTYCSARHDLQCYALPYGGLGFISDVLTLYTIWMLSRGYTPWFPNRELVGSRFDAILALVGSCGTVASIIYTMVRCHRRLAFVFIAIWKLF